MTTLKRATAATLLAPALVTEQADDHAVADNLDI